MSARSRHKYPRVLMASLVGLLATIPLAIADTASAPPQPALDGHALGLADGLLKYCMQADPQSTPALQTRLDELIKKTPRDSVARLREAAEYRQAYDSITDFTGKVPAENAKVLCSRAATAN